MVDGKRPVQKSHGQRPRPSKPAAGSGRLVVFNDFLGPAQRPTPAGYLYVRVDGRRVGSVPPGSNLHREDAFRHCRVEIELPPGAHVVRARLFWFHSYAVPVQIEPGVTTWMAANLLPLFGPDGLRTRTIAPGRAVSLVFCDGAFS